MTPIEYARARWVEAGLWLPLYEVVNVPTDDSLPAKWAGLIYNPATTNDLTMGSDPLVLEEGFIVCGLVAKSGEGSDVLRDEAIAVRQAFHGWQSADQLMNVTHVNGPLLVDAQTEGNWFRVAFDMAYQYRFHRGQPASFAQGAGQAAAASTASGAA